MQDNHDHNAGDVPGDGVPNAQEQLRQLVDTALDAVITCDPKSRIVVWNSGAERLFGWTAEEAIGKLLTETIIPLELREAHERGMAHYLKTGEGPVLGQRIEIEAVNRDGRRFPVELSINPIRTSSGLTFSAFIRDITSRLDAERRIREGEARLQFVLDSAQMGILDYRLDAEGVLIDAVVSERALSILGEDGRRLPVDRVGINLEDLPNLVGAWNRHLQGDVEHFDVEYRISNNGGDDWTWVKELGTVVERDEHSRPIRVVGSVADVTQQRVLEETLLATQKFEALGLVAGGFAHDLNNVLASIHGHASLIRMDRTISSQTEESVRVIDLAVTRGRSLTQNMLQLGRPARMRREEVVLVDAVKETLDLVRPALPKSIRVESGDDIDETTLVRIDPSQLQQAMLNIVLNARDAMEAGGVLQITTRIEKVEDAPHDFAVIAIADSGKGIPIQDQPRIMDPFFTTKGVKGTGLGLSMVSRMVDEARGEFRIDSVEGEGTTVEIRLPVSSGDSRSASGLEPGAPQVDGGMVLLAEDHPLLRPMLAEAITIAGYEVRSAEDADSARAIGTDRKPDIMVMDIDLPGGSGDDIARGLRRHWDDEIPIVFITGNNEFEQPDWPAVTLLRKPFDLEVLAESIRGLLRARG